MKKHISLEEAVDILNNNITSLEIEEVNLLDGVSKVLAEDIYAIIDNPPFNRSAMDGYALSSKNTKAVNMKFKVIGEVFAGYNYAGEVLENEAIKITTGAPIPVGTNSVIKQEDVDYIDGYIKLNKNILTNDNVCFQGEDTKKGQLLVSKNKKLNYSDIGIIASSGINTIKVYRKPNIGFISTGDEILDIDDAFSYGKIYNSNKYSILARINELRYDIGYITHVRDNGRQIGNLIKNISNDVDLIITTGGASVGEKDLIKESISEIGGEILFWKIKIKPGSAVVCSKYKNTVIISLSGNPTAALTTFELLVKSSLEKLSGMKKIVIKREKAILLNEINKESFQRRFIRGKLEYDNGNQGVSVTQLKSGNGMLSSTLNSNCLIEIESGNKGLKYGELVDIIKF